MHCCSWHHSLHVASLEPSVARHDEVAMPFDSALASPREVDAEGALQRKASSLNRMHLVTFTTPAHLTTIEPAREVVLAGCASRESLSTSGA